MQLNESMLDELYTWIDNVPLSNSNSNSTGRIERDFADGSDPFDASTRAERRTCSSSFL
jgi:hypothetical protein